jgi:hypothetical protein
MIIGASAGAMKGALAGALADVFLNGQGFNRKKVKKNVLKGKGKVIPFKHADELLEDALEKQAISYNAFKQKIRDKMIDAFVKKDVAFSQIGNKGDNIIKKVVPKARLPEGFSKDLLDKAVNVAVLGKPEF